MHVAVAVLRVQEGLDYTGIIGDFDSMEDFSSGKLKSEGIDNPQYTNTLEGSIASSNTTPFSKSIIICWFGKKTCCLISQLRSYSHFRKCEQLLVRIYTGRNSRWENQTEQNPIVVNGKQCDQHHLCLQFLRRAEAYEKVSSFVQV